MKDTIQVGTLTRKENNVRNLFGVDVLEMPIDLKVEKIVKHCVM